MRLLSILFILFASQMASANLRCTELFPVDTRGAWRTEHNRVFRENMLGKSSAEKELYFYWHTLFPMDIKQVDYQNDVAYRSHKRIRVYRNNNDLNEPNPLSIIHTMGRSTQNETMLKAFIENYKGRVSEPIIRAVKELENLLANMSEVRQGFGYVATAPEHHGGQMLGTFRIFDGTLSHSNSIPFLPMEVSFLRDHVRPKLIERLIQLRTTDPDAPIYEIGKFSVNAPPREAERVRNMLELFLLRYYVDILPDHALYFAHTVSEAHVRRYTSRYGMKVTEEVRIPNQVETEYIMEVTGKDLRKALRRTHKIPERGTAITIQTSDIAQILYDNDAAEAAQVQQSEQTSP